MTHFGFLAMFFQELCEAKLEWVIQQPLGKMVLTEIQPGRGTVNLGSSMLLHRSLTLCGFCDASAKAYAGVVYLLLEMESGCSVRFVAAKTHVSPLKEQTILRLELLSALLLARLLASITQSLESELQLSPSRCFTNSTVTLC